MNVKQNHLFKAAVCGLFIACALSWLAAAGPPGQREAVKEKGLRVSFKLVELYEELKNWLAPGA